MNEQEIMDQIHESILPSCMVGLLPDRKALGARHVKALQQKGFTVHSLNGGTTGVITIGDKQGFTFVKLTRYGKQTADFLQLRND